MKVLLSIICLLWSGSVFAQKSGDLLMPQERSYAVEPSGTIVETTTILDEVTKYYIHFKNMTGKDLRLGWKKLSMNIPAGWDYSLCDLGTCYSGIPDGEFIMFTVAKDSSGFLAPNIYPDNNNGTFSLTMAVWDVDNPSITDTLSWVITAKAQAGVSNSNDNHYRISSYPNPATTSTTIQLGNTSTGSITLVSANGAIVLEHRVKNVSSISLDLSSVSAGEYFVVFTNTAGSILRTKLIKN